MSFNPASITTAFTFQDGFQTTLSSGITAVDTVIPLTALPTGVEGTVVIEPATANEEEIYFTSQGTGVVNCPSASAGRGVNSTAVAHNAGVTVKMLLTKATMDALKYGGGILDASLKTKKMTAKKQQGWEDIYETVTCGTNNILTISASGYGASVEVGDKIALVDDGTQIYGYVVAKASTTATLVCADATGAAVTLTAGSTITLPYYSKVTSPVGFPGGFNYTPTGPTNVTLTGRFSISGRKLSGWVRGAVTGAVDWTNMPTIPVPASSSLSVSGQFPRIGEVHMLDANASYINGGYVVMDSSLTKIILYASDTSVVSATGPFTWANGDGFHVKFTYEI